MANAHLSETVELMTHFAERTGLSPGSRTEPPRRYLWTDAFAVCNLLGLQRETGDARHGEMAARLVDQVHHQLGRHRADDPRSGWLSGLPADEAEMHPTSGGLRIGKPLPERDACDRLDHDLEWERDGQYFHYLTKWMHALDQMTRSTGQPSFNVWARELAVAAHRAFTYRVGLHTRMVWKASIDLSRPLVTSMGHHDPLDGFVTCTQLDATARELGIAPTPSLAAQTADFAKMIDRDALATDDPLGIGGLLVDACRLVQLEHQDRDLITALFAAALTGVRQYCALPDLQARPDRRLGFRELGLAIGLAGVELLEPVPAARLGPGGRDTLAQLARYLPLRTEIESFWLHPEHRRTPTWLGHADINDVMLATSLAPDAFVVLPSPRRPQGLRPLAP